MALIRPEIRDWVKLRQELLIVGALVLFGAFVATRGGWFYAGLGLIIALPAAMLALASLRRLAFTREINAPGLVEIDEGEIRFLSARALGGRIALRDLTEIRLLRLNGYDHWRLRSRGGEALLIPVEAAGAEKLADAFTALPGIDMGRVAQALGERDGPSLRVLWTRPAPA